MIIIITVDVSDRINGYLSSLMLEVNPGVFASPAMTKAVVEKTWEIVSGWRSETGKGNILMVKVEKDLPGGLGLRYDGSSRRKIIEIDDVLCAEKAI